jgi:hypothetical protein
MGNYLYMNEGLPITFNSDSVPSLDGNPRGEHLIKIAIALEQEGIDGVHVEYIKEKDRVVLMLHLAQDSLGQRLLDVFADWLQKSNQVPTVELAIQMAKYVQKMEARSL